MNEFARVILGKALQLINQLEENAPAGATLERMSNQVSKEITVFDAFTDLNSNAIRKVRSGQGREARPPYAFESTEFVALLDVYGSTPPSAEMPTCGA